MLVFTTNYWACKESRTHVIRASRIMSVRELFFALLLIPKGFILSDWQLSDQRRHGIKYRLLYIQIYSLPLAINLCF